LKNHIKEIENYAKSLGFDCYSKNCSLRISNPQTAFFLNVEVENKNKIYVYCSVRLSSHQVMDERTDFHEILSLLFASFIRSNKPYWNSTFADMGHPVIDAPTEIYLRQIIFTQPHNGESSFVVFNIAKTKKIIELLYSFNYLTADFIGYAHTLERGFVLPCLNYSWEIELKRALGAFGKLWQTNIRVNPNWFHYIDVSNGVSLIKSENVANALKLFVLKIGKQKYIRYKNFDLVFNKKNQNLQSKQLIVNGYRVLNSFGTSGRFYKLILDACVVLIKDNLIYVCYSSTGQSVVEYAKKDIIQRRMLENKYLFKKEAYKWNEPSDPELFEDFCLSILKVLPQTVSVRKASPLNEPDEGMDIIWEVQSVSPRAMGENIPPFITERIVVQCKASCRPVGKGVVTDVSDTIEYHNASGYFLMTSASSVTRTLRNYLLKKKDRGFKIDWWSSIEIEEVVDKHPQLLSGYESLIKML
jgi:hypothetical protein